MISKENAEHYQWSDRCDGWYLVNRLCHYGRRETQEYTAVIFTLNRHAAPSVDIALLRL